MISTDTMLRKAKAEHYAVSAFNVENMEMLQACIRAAKSRQSPVIIQASEKTVAYMGWEMLYAMVMSYEGMHIPVALHLDHAKTIPAIEKACKIGFSSVMIDASDKVLSENIAITKESVLVAKEYGVPVEAELGHVGGKEGEADTTYTIPEEAERFVSETQVDSLAVAIGTSHGLYKGTPQIDFGRLESIAKLVDIPLVLHGASGLDDRTIHACVNRGIAKINFATELRQSYTRTILSVLKKDKSLIDPRKYGGEAVREVERTAGHYIDICGCGGRYEY